MKIDVSDLLKGKSKDKEIDLSIQQNSFYNKGEVIEFLKPIKLNGKLSKVGDTVMLDGKIVTELNLTCSRCLDKFKYPININIHEVFSENEDSKNDDVIFINDDIIDIIEVIDNNIIMALPIKKLCKEECKGLCQQCGTNLNFSTCDCKKEEIDPRLAKLQEFFSDN